MTVRPPLRPIAPGRAVRRAFLLTAPLLLLACSGGERQPGAVSADEARQLNEAAEMLDANSVDLNAVADQDQEQL